MALRKFVKGFAAGAGGFVTVKFLYETGQPKSFESGLALGAAYKKFGGVFQALMDAERAHRLAVQQASTARWWRRALGLVDEGEDDPILSTRVWGLEFDNPIGISAGFDKHAEAMKGLFDMGFGMVEIGSVTPLPQPGNPKPRVFRLPEDKCVINRYGFNSEGHAAAAARLSRYRTDKDSSNRSGVLGVNLGKNKTSPDAIGDYTKGIESLGTFADYLVVNVSSPNTPGLRDLQGKKALHSLLARVKQTRDLLPNQPPLLVKIAPDLTDHDKDDIADVVMDLGIDGIIISNTTIKRPDSLQSKNKAEGGGLSGAILMEDSTQVLRDIYRRTKGTVPLIGVGGVCNGDDAYQKIRAGASLVQLYTAFSYDGPVLIREIKQTLQANLERDGFKSVSEAVGVDVPEVTVT